MFRITVGTDYSGEFFDQTFDAPDWQTALIAAAEVVKADREPVCTNLEGCPAHVGAPGVHATDDSFDRWAPDSACDLGDEEPGDAANPLTWEGRYHELRRAYDENRAKLERLAWQWDDREAVGERLAELGTDWHA